MSKFTQTLCILFAFVSLFSNATESRPDPAIHASAPENPPSCDGFKLKMNDCSPYLKIDSSMSEPGASCCSGVMDVWKVDHNCSSEVLKSLVKLKDMNETRVTHVSSTCGFMDISLDKYLEASLLEGKLIYEEKDKKVALMVLSVEPLTRSLLLTCLAPKLTCSGLDV
uniref:Bifunctional inhibitor/plant lipid transfer protein/seed storage helical domain-containing protein n=1 Tax=Tanacetum cinerariifolium TaxID=118510 RepID=A0A6L2P3R0_TANCI|nr:hypothetical protein [Tanacetum cinerariifolium]